jgi:hypothetical protein
MEAAILFRMTEESTHKMHTFAQVLSNNILIIECEEVP